MCGYAKCIAIITLLKGVDMTEKKDETIRMQLKISRDQAPQLYDYLKDVKSGFRPERIRSAATYGIMVMMAIEGKVDLKAMAEYREKTRKPPINTGVKKN